MPSKSALSANLRTIGVLRSELKACNTAPKQGSEEGAPDAWLELEPWASAGTMGLAAGDEVIVVTWLHEADRAALQVHPRSDHRNPLRGVFATRSEDRPNPLGLHPVTLREIDGDRLRVGPIEAIDGTPVVDLKPVLKPRSQEQTIDTFVAAFNRNDLDAVMGHFAVDAVYRPGDGREHRGLEAIRAAFEPQFAGAYGRMRFDEHDRVEDLDARKVAIRWTCHHDLRGAEPGRVRWWALHTLVRSVLGPRFGWEGIDVFHFDQAGRISGKFTYANYPLPLLRRGA